MQYKRHLKKNALIYRIMLKFSALCTKFLLQSQAEAGLL